jgi:hypothetical protein
VSMHSVPCWCCLDKDFAVFGSGYICVHFPVPFLPHLGFALLQSHDDELTQSPWSLTATRGASVHLDNPLLETNLCRNELVSLQLLSLPSSIRSYAPQKGCALSGEVVRAFGRHTPALGQKSVPFHPGNGSQTHIDVKNTESLHRCALLGETTFIFFLVPHQLSHLWTEGPAGSVL